MEAPLKIWAEGCFVLKEKGVQCRNISLLCVKTQMFSVLVRWITAYMMENGCIVISPEERGPRVLWVPGTNHHTELADT